jgi:hypothetical protein
VSFPPLKRGYKGEPVERWQAFLRGLGYPILVDGDFGPITGGFTMQFQQAMGVKPANGEVGNCTIGAAMSKGFEVLPTGEADERAFPEKPEGLRSLTHAERLTKFGSFEFAPDPTSANPEGIRITSRSPEFRLVEVFLPKMVGINGFPRSGKVLFHAKAAPALVSLVDAWDKAGLLGKVLSWGGSYVPRFVRGSRKTLSNHSWGTAFDINAAWNGLGRMPQRRGEVGSVRELVPLAIEHGFFWGGWFTRPDGMHFEHRGET